MTSALESRRNSVPQRDAVVMVVLVRGDAELASWPLARAGRPDVSVVDHLARLQLTARRLGCSILLRDPCAELCELLELVGLSDVLTRVRKLGIETGRESEDGEQLGVEEVVEPGDPTACGLDDLERPRQVTTLGIAAVLTEGGATVGGGRQQP